MEVKTFSGTPEEVEREMQGFVCNCVGEVVSLAQSSYNNGGTAGIAVTMIYRPHSYNPPILR